MGNPASELAKKKWIGKSKAERSAIARAVANARWAKLAGDDRAAATAPARAARRKKREKAKRRG